jgi:solute carrier family 23 (nucleobase transporter), member 1
LFVPLVGAVGLCYLQFCNLNSFRTIFILGFSFFMGLSVPQYFNEFTAVAGHGPVHTGARWVRKKSYTLVTFCFSFDRLY